MAKQVTTKLTTKTVTGRREPKDWRKYCDLRAVYSLFIKNRNKNQTISFSVLFQALEVKNSQPKIQQPADFFETFDGRYERERKEILQLCLDCLVEAGVLALYKDGENSYYSAANLAYV